MTELAFPRRLRLDRERVHAAGQFRGERRIYHAMAVDPALPFEGGRHDIHPKVRLAARLMAEKTKQNDKKNTNISKKK
jgi:hypothetical protein